ncbi:soluble lytic murein transglycosylase [Phenylobacterium zucineum HLK1]|uniref:Soluble lytic murein transglycosylase n=1 Tax=Phenylobacterium zucineum (strain HLK1) TaxID=450851 RepID=B4R998_PHEZH|nr:lytic transglycosylase domain-containing protein [Phenylobacterium zucineum]ACG77768.1 soluble lytic murein transglycosylase [Phenylobacterium zucineum HLK1]
MTPIKRLCMGAAALSILAASAGAAAAESPRPLSDRDARAYAAAFAAADQGDFVGAQIAAAGIKDNSLLGYLSFRQLMHPTAHKASFEELSGWLSKFRDLPLADRVFSLAAKRKPSGAEAPPAPDVGPDPNAESARKAREAYYSGEPQKAFLLAAAAGERWIAGLSAYRLKNFPEAEVHFADLARDEDEDSWLRSAAAFWAARSAEALGDAVTAQTFLRLAAQAPETFYGMIAERRVQLVQAQAPTGQIVLASYRAPPPAPKADPAHLLASQPRAHRAAALVQIGRFEEARQEIRAGLAAAAPDERRAWNRLAADLRLGRAAAEKPTPGYRILGSDYPVPALEPKWGFTVDRALVYALVWQESRFNPQAVSPAGAIGLMQLMPETAARAAGDDKLKKDASPLFDPAFNLRVGQDYLTWLMERGVGYDLLRTVAAYNGGPGAVMKAAANAGDDDPLLLIESLPAQETRAYVEKVLAAYWTYKRMFGEEARSLDALASGARTIDARLDLPDARGPQPELTAKTIQVGLLKADYAGALD